MSGAASSPLPPLHVIATDAETTRADFLELAAALRQACGAALALHLRAPGPPARRLFRLAAALAADASDRGGWCVVNERVDVAIAAGAQAIQLGAGALPPSEARRLAPAGTAIGASVHEARAARDALRSGANYVVVGTIYPSATHAGRSPAGPALLAACAAEGPVVAIGGIRAELVAEVARAGARGVAVIRAVWGAGDPVRAARRLVEELREAGLAPREAGLASREAAPKGPAPTERDAEEGASS